MYLIKVESQLNFDSVSRLVSLLHGTENEQVENGTQGCLESRIVPSLDSFVDNEELPTFKHREKELYHKHHTHIFHKWLKVGYINSYKTTNF